MKITLRCPIGLLAAVLAIGMDCSPAFSVDDQQFLEQNFLSPPGSARPWVYWFWSNGNVTKAGITADLESMERVGIGGVIIMDVVENFAPPEGPATFMGDEWRSDFQFAVSEAARLGLEINMTNGPGWCGSSGPWITPENSMQHLVVAETPVHGPMHFAEELAKADVSQKKPDDTRNSQVSTGNFYRDVAVIAFPTTADGLVTHQSVLNLTSKMDASGNLVWDIPAGDWIVQRYGHASTGSSTRPPVLGGNGLECDKLSPRGMDAQFAGMMNELLDAAGPLAAKSLVATHIDSWEVGKQDWTEHLPDEFKQRWGYDLLTFLPELNVEQPGKNPPHREIDDGAMGDRFRWDFYQLISELMAKNYTGRIAQLAHARGLRFTTEGYELPFADEFLYTQAADEPMTEFWASGDFASKVTRYKAAQMASVAHVMGHAIVGAESFTSDDNEKWKMHPATIKALGDYEFSQGVNRFVIHRFAHQPWLDRAPGATMGPWGLHYERTNTWWEFSSAWHQYVARCSWMLRQGFYVADLLYLRPQYPNQTYLDLTPALPDGYRCDQISAEALINRVTVKDHRLVLPDGMSYRVLVLPPNSAVITPELAEKIRGLVKAGATVLGAKPVHAPGLKDYPQCDQQVAAAGDEAWGNADGKIAAEHDLGSGKVFCGVDLAKVLLLQKIEPDFISASSLNWIHRKAGDADIYFVANPNDTVLTTSCTFRDGEGPAEIWNPVTGQREAMASGPSVELHLERSGSRFIVFRSHFDSAQIPFAVGKTEKIAEISGPWMVRFPPKLGAPAEATFDKLISWTDSPNEGIRHFSGTATYSKTFQADPAWLINRHRFVLNLGDVQVMAKVKLNGQDEGIMWKSPYEVEVTNAIKAGENQLEISVVNLWPNRMIGDAALSEKDRISWSTWTPFKSDTSLLPSGLIGPVELRGESSR